MHDYFGNYTVTQTSQRTKHTSTIKLFPIFINKTKKERKWRTKEVIRKTISSFLITKNIVTNRADSSSLSFQNIVLVVCFDFGSGLC